LADRIKRFESVALPHLDAAYNLARWLTRDPHDAEDVVQEAYLRALRFFDGLREGDARPWLLTIVRHVCYDWMRKNRPQEVVGDIEEEELRDRADTETTIGQNPETLLLRAADRAMINRAIEALPAAFREVLILRELEELSYEQIAAVAGVPIGTVMSRLSRARALIRKAVTEDEKRAKEGAQR
jgi:RNA polymerase sigma factor (sigma-70 family)